jgi:threonyl-tRNA synthetase
MPTEITVLLPDGSARAVPAGTTTADLAALIGRRLAAAAVAAEVDGAMVDLSQPLFDGAKVRIITAASDEGRVVLRHSTAHVLAQAVLRLWPGARYAIGGRLLLRLRAAARGALFRRRPRPDRR